MLERSRARVQALQILFQREVTGAPAARIIAERAFVDDEFGPQEPSEFCRALALGTEANLDAVDQRLSEVSEHWVVSRMPLVDRNILRLAVFELLFLDEVPPSVTINEAVELAKTYGGEDSSKFVNGVLGRIADQLELRAAPTDGSGESASSTGESGEIPGDEVASVDAGVEAPSLGEESMNG